MDFLTIEKIKNHHLFVFWNTFVEMLGIEASPHFSNQMTWDHIPHEQRTASLFDRSFANFSFLCCHHFTAIPIVHHSQKV
jgi:hypothetical protein